MQQNSKTIFAQLHSEYYLKIGLLIAT